MMLSVVLGTIKKGYSTRWRDDGRLAYRVQHRDIDGRMRALPMQFARERDAQAALKAIEGLADWSKPYAVLVQTLDLELVRASMLEAMAW